MLMATGPYGPEYEPEFKRMKRWVALLRYELGGFLMFQGGICVLVFNLEPDMAQRDVATQVTLYGLSAMLICWGAQLCVYTARHRPGVFSEEKTITRRQYARTCFYLNCMSGAVTFLTLVAFLLRWY